MRLVLDFLQNVGVIDVVLDGVGYGVVPADVLVVELDAFLFDVLFHLLVFDLLDQVISEDLSVLVLDVFCEVLLVLDLLEMARKVLAFLVSPQPIHVLGILLPLDLVFEDVLQGNIVGHFVQNVLVVVLVEGLAAVEVPLYELFYPVVFVFVVVPKLPFLLALLAFFVLMEQFRILVLISEWGLILVRRDGLALLMRVESGSWDMTVPELPFP